ncbi:MULTISPECIES: prephenate dehydrogenase/arogenate dehydrogenase family protein [unclassified Neisseria]|uniref:prephenate dehydrogenase n=1 Tax=unclassified Neisseria TaxID=2623750 RepID=UPI0010724E68|nr:MULTISPECIES: prephenate dehydrogenase/arogenate dehydrogenase family protein [unclassified Neisseria]MBF0804432.1 prephenate dehydrogenase/arogenate dehydrogenase family protein [Neisseria sp. 19428wB4_WF04]TFU42799.1 prephenate dehydrogenase/arogenate dehydrogenase family protein [Neisseria sp. WF04]
MESPTAPQHITLIGVGLIGGSFVLDLKHKGLAGGVTGIDLNRSNLERALERKVIDRAFECICAEAVGGADLVVIATPVATLPAVCVQLAPLLDYRTVVTDVGSTKQSAINAFRQYLPQHLPRCIAAHPIAGSDRSGALAAQFGLFQNKKLIICPHGKEDSDGLYLVESLWRSAGAQISRMSAHEHDAVFAAVSHLPHLLAYAYVHQIATHPDGEVYFDFAASGFRDFTRIASSHPAVWADICMANKHSLTALVDGQQQQLAVLKAMLEAGDAAALYRYFEKARQARDDWSASQ